MVTINIKKHTSTKQLNALFNQHLNTDLNRDIKLIIPSSIDKFTFGLLGDLLRLIITLNSKSLIKVLQIEVDKKNLHFIYDQEFAYPIISLLWNNSKFIDSEGNDIKSLLRDYQNNYFISMNSLSPLKGRKYLLNSADHLSDNKGLIKLFESKFGFNNEELISQNIIKILENHVLTFNKNNIKDIENSLQDVGAMVYELMKNTYEWGRSDFNSTDLSCSIRGVYFRFYTKKLNNIVEEFKDTPLENFFNSDEVKRTYINDLNQIYYLEILVYDSGIGFIEKFSKNDNIEDIEIIKKCLVKNQTSSNSNLKSKKGIGLDRMLNLLNNRGFLRISTDKYCVFRDLIKNNYEFTNSDSTKNLILEHWENTKSNLKAQGSFISILYPFKKN